MQSAGGVQARCQATPHLSHFIEEARRGKQGPVQGATAAEETTAEKTNQVRLTPVGIFWGEGGSRRPSQAHAAPSLQTQPRTKRCGSASVSPPMKRAPDFPCSPAPGSPRSHLDHAGALPGTPSMRSECTGQPRGSAQDVEAWVTEKGRCPVKQPPPPATSFVPIARRRTKSPRPRAAFAAPTRQRRTPIHPARPFPLPACSTHPC